MAKVAQSITRVIRKSLVSVFYIISHTDHYVVVLSCLDNFDPEFSTLVVVNRVIEDIMCPGGIGASVLDFESF